MKSMNYISINTTKNRKYGKIKRLYLFQSQKCVYFKENRDTTKVSGYIIDIFVNILF